MINKVSSISADQQFSLNSIKKTNVSDKHANLQDSQGFSPSLSKVSKNMFIAFRGVEDKKEVKNLLNDTTLIVVSNRGKYNAKAGKDGKISYGESAGGLANAMDNALKGTGGTWISWTGEKKPLDIPEVHEPKEAGYGVSHINIPSEDYGVFYNRVSNGLIWPTMHFINDQVKGELGKYRDEVSDQEWGTYKKVNQQYADNTVKQLKQKQGQKKDNLIWVQDYQLMLTPGMIREKVQDDKNLSDTKMGYFHHIPFPKADLFIESFGEDRAKETVNSLLKNDVVGFHVPSYVNNFMDTVEKLDMENVQVNRKDSSITTTNPASGKTHKTTIADYPISLDVEHLQKQGESVEVQQKMNEIKKSIKEQNPETQHIIFGGAERADYTKNLVTRVDAIEKFFAETPEEDRKKYTAVLIVAGSRLDIGHYKDNFEKIAAKVEKVNEKYGQKDHKKPIIQVGTVPYKDVAAYMKLADVVVVNPVADGMNLAAKEAPVMKVLNQDRPYELVLTKNAGIGQDPVFQKDALMIDNPLDYRETANRMKEGFYNLRNRESSVKSRNENLLEHVKDFDINKWTKNFIKDLKTEKKGN